MTEQSKVLSKGRKKRVMPEGLASVDDVEKFGLLSSHPLHKSTKVGSCARAACLPSPQKADGRTAGLHRTLHATSRSIQSHTHRSVPGRNPFGAWRLSLYAPSLQAGPCGENVAR